MCQVQARATPLIWQPGIFVSQEPAPWAALHNGLVDFWYLSTFLPLELFNTDDGPGNVTLSPEGTTAAADGTVPRPWPSAAVFNGFATTQGVVSASSLIPPIWTLILSFKFSSVAGAQIIAGYYVNGTAVWEIGLVSGFIFARVNNSGDYTTLVWPNAATTGVWYYAVLVYDETIHDLILTIRQGAGTAVSTSNSVGQQQVNWSAIPNHRIVMGCTAALTNFFVGSLGPVGFWSRRHNLVERNFLNSSWGDPAGLFTPASGSGQTDAPTTPIAPSDVSAVGTPVSIEFTDHTSGLYQHEIWRDEGDGHFALLTTLESGITEYEDATGSEILNSYKVRAVGRGNPSAFATAYVTAPVDAPLAFNFLDPLADLSFSWALEGDSVIWGFRIYKADDGSISWSQFRSDFPADATTAEADTDTGPTLQRAYKLTGFNGSGDGPECVSILYSAPKAPTITSAVAESPLMVNLEWTHAGEIAEGWLNETDTYEVEYRNLTQETGWTAFGFFAFANTSQAIDFSGTGGNDADEVELRIRAYSPSYVPGPWITSETISLVG